MCRILITATWKSRFNVEAINLIWITLNFLNHRVTIGPILFLLYDTKEAVLQVRPARRWVMYAVQASVYNANFCPLILTHRQLQRAHFY